MHTGTFFGLHRAADDRLPAGVREFVKFGVVGSIGFVVDFGTYAILTRIVHWDTVYCLSIGGAASRIPLDAIRACGTPHYPIVAANMVSVLLAVGSNFFLNKFWTFRNPSRSLAAQGSAYLVMSTITWTVNQVLTGIFASRIALLHTLFGDSVDVAAKVLAIAVVLFLNFGGSKFVIFRKRSAAFREAAP